MTLQDAIYELLGVPLDQQPADYYRLLGLVPFESNTEVITNAASRQMLFVRQLASGPYSSIAQDLLDLLSEAKVCLLNTQRRNRYDAELRQAASDGLLDEKLQSIETARLAALPVAGNGAAEQSHAELADSESAMLSASVWQESMAQQSAAAMNGSSPSAFVSDSPLGNISGQPATPLSDSKLASSSDADVPIEAQVPSTLGTGQASKLDPHPARREIESASADSQAKLNAGADTAVSVDGHGGERGQKTWVIGAGTDCDTIVRCPYVSRRHCRVTASGGRYWVEDMGSRNGTRVNRQLVRGKTEVTGDDLITLGRFARMPWPAEIQDSVMRHTSQHGIAEHQSSHEDVHPRTERVEPEQNLERESWGREPASGSQEVNIIRIGRSLSNEVVLNHPSVSRRHAQLTVYSDYAVLEDFGSTNGTFVGNSAMRINRRYVKLTDLVRVGKFTMPVSQLLHQETVA